jgi:hypothetical protein
VRKDNITVGIILIVLIGFILLVNWGNVNPDLIYNR